MTLRLLISLLVIQQSTAFAVKRTGAGVSLSSIRVEQSGEVPSVLVTLEFRGGESGVAIPYCGTAKDGERLLCLEAAHLQRRVGGQWHPVLLRRTLGVLGGTPRTGIVAIEAHGTQLLTFLFSRRFFEVEPGEQLRLVVDAWPDEGSVPEQFDIGKSGHVAGMRFETATFRCPAVPWKMVP